MDELVATREALSRELARVRHSMAQQEQAVRDSLSLLKRAGASFAIPPELARTLAKATASPFASMTASGSPTLSALLSPRARPASASPSPSAPHAHGLRTSGAASLSAASSPRPLYFNSPRAAGGSPSPRPASAAPVPAAAGGAAARRGVSVAAVTSSVTATGVPRRARPLSASAQLLRASKGATSVTASYPMASPRSHSGAAGVAASAGAGFSKGAAGAAAEQQQRMHKYTTAGPIAADVLARREEELRRVLREEIDKETERQAILAGISDQGELNRLTMIFQAERDEAKKRILTLSSAVHSASAAGPQPPATAGVAAQGVHASAVLKGEKPAPGGAVMEHLYATGAVPAGMAASAGGYHATATVLVQPRA